jgi:hypothetical protein
MSKRSKPFRSDVMTAKGKRLAKQTGHGSYTKKRHPTAKWVRNGVLT